MSYAVKSRPKSFQSPDLSSQLERSSSQTSLKISELSKNISQKSLSEWRLSLQGRVSEIGETNPKKASVLSRMLLGYKKTNDQKDLLEKLLEIEVPNTFYEPGLLGGVIGGEEALAIAILKGAVTLLMRGSENDLKEKLNPRILQEAVIQLSNGEKIMGQHEGGRVIKENGRSIKNWGRKIYQFQAYGKGKFTSDRVTYIGDFVDGLFHDLTGEAQLFIKDLRYTGCFNKGKKCGHGTLEKYDSQRGEFYIYYKGIWEEDQPKDGIYYSSEGRKIAKMSKGTIQQGENSLDQIIGHAREGKRKEKEKTDAINKFRDELFAPKINHFQEEESKEEEMERIIGSGHRSQSSSSSSAIAVVPRIPDAISLSRIAFGKSCVITVAHQIPDAISRIVFGREDWERYFGVVEAAPLPLIPNMKEVLQSPCIIWEGKRVMDTHLLTLVPRTVNGQLLTLNSLEALVQKPKGGYNTRYDFYSDYAKKSFGKKVISHSYWALMTKDVLPGSEGKSYQEQCEIIAEYGYQQPPILAEVVSILMHYVKTGEMLYSDTYSRSRKVDEKGNHLVVGRFSNSGINIHHDYGRHYDAVNVHGIVGFRKF